MTLHQLTHTVTFEMDLGAVTALRRLLARVGTLSRRWLAQRRLETEMAALDHRERSDLGCRI